MRPTLWAEAKRVFGAALDVPSDRREAFVRAECGSEQVCVEVLRLLARHGRLTGFLEVPVGLVVGAARSAAAGDTASARPAAADAPSRLGPPQLAAGAFVVGRYELGPRLGAGAFGAVHRARDTLTGNDVAVKVLHLAGDAESIAMRREIAILRLSRLPGLVELLDDGMEQGQAFIVMRLVEGRPFPGDLPGVPGSRAVRWDDVAPRAIALVEALGRLHWLGILHRDIKPDNVLVSPSGAVTIVDLGVARDVHVGGESESTYIVGTPAYLAPERLAGAAASVASDLYAVGTMLYECLAGRPLRSGDDVNALFRRDESVAPLATVASHVPRHVAETVDALLRSDPADRPRSARLVAAMLRGEGEPGARIRLPFVGSDAAVSAVIDAVKAKRPHDLAGRTGSGRTRTLEEAGERLTADGYRVLWCRPGTKPFESLGPVVGDLPDEPDLGLDELRATLCRCLRLWLGVGVAVVADDWDRIDPHSRAVLDAVRSAGPLVRVLDASPAGAGGAAENVPPPRTESELRSLFAGPDRLFHLREDAARELHHRTGGVPGDCVHEIEAWIDGGIARWEDGRVVIEREGIERLRYHPAPAPLALAADAESLSARAEDVLAVLETARHELAPAVVGRVLSMAPWEVETAVAELSARGFVREVDGALRCIRAAALTRDPASSADLARLHAVLADHAPKHSEIRFFHLVAGERVEEALKDRIEAALASLQAGRIERALAATREGLALWRRGARVHASYAALMQQYFDIALAAGTPAALRTLLAEFDRDPQAAATLQGTPALARAAHDAVTGSARRAAEAARSWVDSVDPEIARRAFTVLTLAARAANDLAAERAAVLAALGWVRRTRSHRAGTHFREWLGWLRYRQGRFASARRLHMAVARRHHHQFARVSALLNAASAALELGRTDDAVATAERARTQATELRLHLLEARAEWIRRSGQLRRGAEQQVDFELVEAARTRLPGSLAALLLMNEAAIALRGGRAALAARLAAEGRALVTAAERPELRGLLDGIRISSGDAVAPEVVDGVLRAAEASGPSRLSDQLHALAAPRTSPRRRIVTSAPDASRVHGEVLSPDDVVARIRGGSHREREEIE